MIIDKKIIGTDIEKDANKIRDSFRSIIMHTDIRLQKIISIVKKYGFENISTELGEDATEMSQLFTALKNIVETYGNITVGSF